MTVFQLIDTFYNAFLGESRFVIYDCGTSPAYSGLVVGDFWKRFGKREVNCFAVDEVQNSHAAKTVSIYLKFDRNCAPAGRLREEGQHQIKEVEA